MVAYEEMFVKCNTDSRSGEVRKYTNTRWVEQISKFFISLILAIVYKSEFYVYF